MNVKGASAKPSLSAEVQDLTKRAFSGIVWTFSGVGVRVVFETVVLFLLSRLLTPLDFGISTAAITVIRFAEIIAQSGVGQAIVQRPALCPEHLETGFTSTLATGLLMAGALHLLSQPIAGLFKMAELAPVLSVLALTFPLRSVSLIAESLLQREVKFKILAGIDVLSYIFGYGLVGVVLAFFECGVMSLVVANLVQVGLKSILLLRAQAHPKRIRIVWWAYRELMYFTWGFISGRICNALAGQGDYIVVARWLGAAPLGLYQRAYQLMAMPANFFGMALDKVLFPVMANIQSNQSRLRKSYRSGVLAIALIVCPASVVMYLLAPEIIALLLGDQWSEVIQPFRILAIGMIFRTSYKMSDSLARATGSVYRRAWRQAVYASMVFAGALVGQTWGVSGVAYGILCAILMNFLLMAQLSLKITGMTWKDFFLAHAPGLSGGFIVWVATACSAYVLRQMAVPKFFVVLLPLCSAIIIFFGLISYFPTRFLGEDGVNLYAIMRSEVKSMLTKARVPNFGKAAKC